MSGRPICLSASPISAYVVSASRNVFPQASGENAGQTRRACWTNVVLHAGSSVHSMTRSRTSPRCIPAPSDCADYLWWDTVGDAVFGDALAGATIEPEHLADFIERRTC